VVPRRVVFVCSGNTCRSPLAEAIARSALFDAGLGLVEVASAGLRAVPGTPAAPDAVAAAEELGLSLATHRARPLEAFPPDERTLFLAMTPSQADELRARLGARAWVEALLPYARAHGAQLPPGDAVEDPFGRDAEAYREVAERLRAALTALARAWAREFSGAPPPPPSGPDTKTLALPRLRGLHPTLESTALKLLEEAGELAEAIGKYRALSGERAGPGRTSRHVLAAIGEELLDVAQTAVTMMFVLEEQYGLALDALLEQHVRKLAAKGYLAPEAMEPAGGPAPAR
jgi:protein-tyrosine-phosphatase/NTP pyrophosphatase (non-canonical NTP hydrolase)